MRKFLGSLILLATFVVISSSARGPVQDGPWPPPVCPPICGTTK